MSELITLLGNPAPVILFVVLALIVLGVTVALFGRETAAGWVKVVWHALRGRGSNTIAIGLLMFLGACASGVTPFADTKKAIQDGDSLAETAAIAVTETKETVKTGCLFLDAPEVVLAVDVIGAIAKRSERVDEIREERRAACEDIGGWIWTRVVSD